MPANFNIESANFNSAESARRLLRDTRLSHLHCWSIGLGDGGWYVYHSVPMQANVEYPTEHDGIGIVYRLTPTPAPSESVSPEDSTTMIYCKNCGTTHECTVCPNCHGMAMESATDTSEQLLAEINRRAALFVRDNFEEPVAEGTLLIVQQAMLVGASIAIEHGA